MKFGVVVFPGSSGAQDILHVLGTVLKQEVVELWHKDTNLPDFETGDCVILPGGAAYGNYLRAGAIAQFSPIMKAIIEFANNGGYVFGIANGFQILCESELLPGVLLKNDAQKFIHKNIFLKTQTNYAPVTSQIKLEKPLKIPIANANGKYFAGQAILEELMNNDQILFKYCDENGEATEESNPNGSLQNIAGICNKERNVFGMMPQPERASEEILGNTDGRILFESLLMNARAEMAIV